MKAVENLVVEFQFTVIEVQEFKYILKINVSLYVYRKLVDELCIELIEIVTINLINNYKEIYLYIFII